MTASIDDLLSLYNLNRTIISSGSKEVVKFLGKIFPEGNIESYQTGAHISTWDIPAQWDLVSAKLTNLSTGRVILTDADSSLFIAPYSNSINKTFSKSDLLKINLSNEILRDDFMYQHRLAYDINRRLKDVGISIPLNILDQMSNDDLYQLEIIIKSEPSQLEIFNYTLNGESDQTVFLLSHYCHTGQINDGLAGVVTCGKVMDKLKKKFSSTKYSYSFLSFPETIGSSIFVAEHNSVLSKGLFSIFSEMPGAVSDFRITNSRRGDTYIDRVSEYILNSENKIYKRVNFREGWGNDEMVFDSPTVGIPSVSVDRFPFVFYHTSGDNPHNFSMSNLEETAEIIFKTLEILERDYIPVPKYISPPYLSKFNLYQDWTASKDLYMYTVKLLDNVISGLSVFDIANIEKIPLDFAYNFFDKLWENGLIDRKLISTDYTRRKI